MLMKKLFPIWLLGLALIVSGIYPNAGFCQQAGEESFTGMIKEDSVNIRGGAGVNFEILRKMDKGELVLVLGNSLDWYKIKLPRNSNAYITKQFLRMEGNSFGYINADRVNVRAGKGTNFNVIGQLNNNDLVEIIEIDNDWVQIFSDNNCFAWVHKDFIINNGPASVYLAQENVNQDAWKLLQQARSFEQSGGGITDEEEKRAACIQKYSAIIRDYPKSTAAVSAKKYISILSEKPAPVIEKTGSQTAAAIQSSAQPQGKPVKKRLTQRPAENPLAQGKIVEAGNFFHRPGTHKLVENNQVKYFLKSETIDLNTYIYHQVQLWGKIASPEKTKIPTIEVEYVDQLN